MQTEGPVTLLEGTSMILNCNYQTTYSSPFLFWYVQYLNKAPQLLLKSSTDNQKVENQGFHAELMKSNNSFHLEKSSFQMSDLAVYYCAVRDTVGEAAGGAEHKPRGLQVGPGCGEPWKRSYILSISNIDSIKGFPRNLNQAQVIPISLRGWQLLCR